MSRLNVLDPASATEGARAVLNGVHKMLGMTPNLFRVVANSPAALNAYTSFSGALGGGSLNAKLREAIALAVAEENGCDYCLSAHAVLGKGAGLNAADIEAARHGGSSDSKNAAAIGFARGLVLSRGRPSSAELDAVRQAGWSDGDIVEIVANVALNVFTNYVNNVAETPIDFPKLETRKAA